MQAKKVLTDPCMTPDEVWADYKICRATGWKYVKQGKLPPFDYVGGVLPRMPTSRHMEWRAKATKRKLSTQAQDEQVIA